MRPVLSDVIGNLYQAADPEVGWAGAVASLAGVVGATQAGFQIADPHNIKGTNLLAAPGTSLEEAALYVAHFKQVDPYATLLQERPVGAVTVSGELLDEELVLRSEYWNDFAGRYGRGFHLVGSRLSTHVGGDAMIGLLRPPEALPFSAEDEATLVTIFPHFASAVRLWHRLTEAEARADAANLMRDALGAVLVVDGQGRLLLVSPAAERMAPEVGLRLGGGRLGFIVPEAAARLRTLIAATAGGGPGGVMVLSQATPLGRLFLQATRLPEQTAAARDRYGRYPVLVELRLLGTRQPSADALRQAFGLGLAEAEVALLTAQGLTAEEVAERRGTSVLTVRSQIRVLLMKTDTRTLRELAGLVNALA
ncbi:LuxR family transcriptional regulator [Humitalea rosea]|uniref:LuxR family transcriptional regulator n=1 Tax=Humitalea rosea TaxID=990373 RepID=A0A2W7IKF2_9PROT|nr:hypothetical protein [Humitalea rosea]PZW39013.1 LuxR family transcriptional regulator [Humitalea rosea]